jgi:hypothetical protein
MKKLILALKSRLQKPTTFLKWNSIDICTDSYENFVGKLNTNVQFILNPYVVASYYIPYLNKVDKNITQ